MLTLRNLTRYGNNYRDAVSTPPRPVTTAANQGTTDPGFNPSAFQLRRTDTKYQHRNDKVTTNQTDLGSVFSTGRVSHSADVGLEVAADRQPTYAFTDTFANGRPPVIDLVNPDPFIAYTPSYARTGATSNADANSVALYLFDTVKFSEHWQADLGIRHDRVKIAYETLSAAGVVANFGRNDHATPGAPDWSTSRSKKAASTPPSAPRSRRSTTRRTGCCSRRRAPPIRRLDLKRAATSRSAPMGPRRSRPLHRRILQLEKTDAKTTDLAGAVTLLGDQEVNGVEFTVASNTYVLSTT